MEALPTTFRQVLSEQYPDAGMRLLTLTSDGIPGAMPDGVTVQPAWAWMLEHDHSERP